MRIINKLIRSSLFWNAATFAVAAAVVACAAALAGCCSGDRMVITLRQVRLSDVDAEVVRAEKAIKDFGLEIDDVDYGCRNGTFINITVTGREKRWADKYFDERQKRLELEKQLRGPQK